MVVLIRLLDINPENREVHDGAGRVAFVSAVIIFAIGFSSFGVIATLLLTGIFLLAPVFAGFKLWVKRMHTKQQESD